MQSRLTTFSIFHHWQTWVLLFLFLALRAISFFIMPYPIAQAIVVMALILLLGLLFFKNPIYAWMMILTELLLGGSGHLFEFFGLSIRTVLILIFLFLWIIFAISKKHDKYIVRIHHHIFYILMILSIVVLFSMVNGLLHNHTMRHIIQDMIPFVFFVLLSPAYHLFHTKRIQHYFIRLIGVFLMGSLLFSVITFTLFVRKITVLHGTYYTWYRDVIMGKITYVTDFFYRIVTPEHLLIPLIMIIIVSLLMRDEKHHYMWRFMFFCGAIIVSLNFSRAYFLGFGIALLFLMYKHTIKRWIRVSLWSIAMIILVFASINILSSMGHSLGLEIAGLRINSFVQPETEISTNTRMALLDPILHTISQSPILGVGLGSAVTYIDPYTFDQITTRQYDWGYFEMIVELGIIGTLIYLILIFALILALIKNIRKISDYHDIYIGFFGAIIALLVINITTPALIHVFGIAFFAFVIAFAIKPITFFDEVVTLLYRVFNKLK